MILGFDTIWFAKGMKTILLMRGAGRVSPRVAISLFSFGPDIGRRDPGSPKVGRCRPFLWKFGW